jgi:heme-degrading monooxygenase HmoA
VTVIYSPTPSTGAEADMISRHWHAIAKRDRAEDYLRYLQTETFPAIRKIAGFLDAWIERRDGARGVEFLVVTRWESIDAVRRFSGVDPDVAVVPASVQAMMVEFDGRVKNYEVVS